MSKALRLLSPPMLVVVLAVLVTVGAATVTDWYIGIMAGSLVLRVFTEYFRGRTDHIGRS